MHRNRFSYCCVRTTRRCGIRFDEVTRFEEELSITYCDLLKTHIVNADESMWLFSGSRGRQALIPEWKQSRLKLMEI
jgi:hypothetical protein